MKYNDLFLVKYILCHCFSINISKFLLLLKHTEYNPIGSHALIYPATHVYYKLSSLRLHQCLRYNLYHHLKNIFDVWIISIPVFALVQPVDLIRIRICSSREPPGTLTKSFSVDNFNELCGLRQSIKKRRK